jgi:hypothetical protein
MLWKPKGMVFHNTGSDDLPGLDADNVYDYLQRERPELKGGYHWMQDNVDKGYWVVAFARPDKPAGHVRHHNSEYVGFAFVGDFNRVAPPLAMLTSAAPDVAALLNLYDLTPADMIMHRDAPDQNTDCPGTLFTANIFEAFRQMVREAGAVALEGNVTGWRDAGSSSQPKET